MIQMRNIILLAMMIISLNATILDNEVVILKSTIVIAQNKNFLDPGKYIESNNIEIIALAKDLTTDLTTDIDKSFALYSWVTNNISYDYDKYDKILNKDYAISIGALNTLKTKTGVCYDYATLLAALGRSIGLESKVIKGQSITGYHAWNEIYSSEEDRWIQIDATRSLFDTIDFNDTHLMEEEM